MWMHLFILTVLLNLSHQSGQNKLQNDELSANFLEENLPNFLHSTKESSLLASAWNALFKRPVTAIKWRFAALSNASVDTINRRENWREEELNVNDVQSGLQDLRDVETAKQLQDLYSLQNPQEEIQDEEDDFEILRSIFTSVLLHKRAWGENLIRKLTQRRFKRDEEVVCFGELGCFRDEGPFDYFDMLPNSPEEVNTQFLMYTKENPIRAQYLYYQNVTDIAKTTFRSDRKTIVIIHGFGSSCDRVWVRELKDTFLKMENINLICVQWANGATTPNYVRAASNTRLVGSQVAVLLGKMVEYANLTLSNVHLVGFSLGAHVSGYCGQRLPGIGRISGLDPAGPLFESFPPHLRLDPSDAKFVDVIHTNADSLLWGGLGAYDQMGHVDFYPNGGRVQNGCANLFVGGVSDILWPKEGTYRYLCNHRRGYKYFMESIVPVCQFPAFACRDYVSFLKGNCFPCSNCGNMGYYADRAPGRGKMFLMTRDTEPFCANQFKVEIWHSGGPPTTESVATHGKLYITFVNQDGKNETIDATRDTGKKIEAGTRTVSIVVPHVALSNIVSLQMEYRAHRGWISSGYNRWAIDKVSIMDSFGKVQSFCHRGLTMESGLRMLLPLVPGNCNPRELTLHPVPVPWQNINTVSSSNEKEFFSNVETTTKPEEFEETNNNEWHASPSEFDVVSSTDTPVDTVIQKVNASKAEINSIGNNSFTSHEAELESETQSSMTDEEYKAWKEAPPPNLHIPSLVEENSISNSTIAEVDFDIAEDSQIFHDVSTIAIKDDLKVMHLKNNTLPLVRKLELPQFPYDTLPLSYPNVIHIPSKINFQHSSFVEGQTDEIIVGSDFENYDMKQNTEPNKLKKTVTEVAFKFDEDPSREKFYLGNMYNKPFDLKNVNMTATRKISNNEDNLFQMVKDLALETDIGLTEEIPFNGLIENEIPFKERSRSMKFSPNENNVDDKIKKQESLESYSDSKLSEEERDPENENTRLIESMASLFEIHEKLKAQNLSLVSAKDLFSSRINENSLKHTYIDKKAVENSYTSEYSHHQYQHPPNFPQIFQTLPPKILLPPKATKGSVARLRSRKNKFKFPSDNFKNSKPSVSLQTFPGKRYVRQYGGHNAQPMSVRMPENKKSGFRPFSLVQHDHPLNYHPMEFTRVAYPVAINYPFNVPVTKHLQNPFPVSKTPAKPKKRNRTGKEIRNPYIVHVIPGRHQPSSGARLPIHLKAPPFGLSSNTPASSKTATGGTLRSKLFPRVKERIANRRNKRMFSSIIASLGDKKEDSYIPIRFSSHSPRRRIHDERPPRD